MKLSQYFLPVLKEVPVEAQIVSHQLMLRSGMIYQECQGIYSWLPLGLRVLRKVANIIREEQNKIGVHEILMPTIQPAELWQESGRYEVYGKEMLRITDRHERGLLYGPTHEEVVTDIFRRYVKSYKELPLAFYQIHWKFRDEIRPRFGIMRSREFLMKDAYSFDLTKDSAITTYHKFLHAYLRTFAKIGIQAIPLRADTGAIGGSLSHEFHILADTGESLIYYDKCFEDVDFGKEDLDLDQVLGIYAMADELHDEAKCPVSPNNLCKKRGIEVGHIFNFGTKYSLSMNASVTGPDGQSIYPEMGSYGIGVGRIVAAVIEASHDENGIIWPNAIAPFDIGLINLKVGEKEVDALCEDLYVQLHNRGLDVLYDDTEERPGSKFATMDLIGVPYQLVVGPRGLQSGMLEIKVRRTGERLELTPEAALNFFQNK